MLPYLTLDYNNSDYIRKEYPLPKYAGESSWLNTTNDLNGAWFGRTTAHNVWIVDGVKDILEPQWFEWLTARNFVVDRMWIFYFNKRSVPGRIHTDGLGHYNYAINWTKGTSQCQQTKWYKALGQASDSTSISRIYQEHEVEEIAQLAITRATLIRTDIPHQGLNLGPGTRWSFSLKPRVLDSSWEETLARFG